MIYPRIGKFCSVSVMALASASLWQPTAQAQTTAASQDAAVNPQDAAAPATEAEIVVTGSRVASSGMAQPTPVTVVSGDNLQAASPKGLAEGVLQLPSFNGSNSRTAGGAAANAGHSYLNLRGLAAPNPYFEEVLPKESRSTREQLIAIADSYFEGLEKHSGAAVQTAPKCRRFENGNQTSLNPLGNNWPCDEMDDYVYMDKIKERRFPIVDVERGVVVGAMVIEVSKPKAPAVPITNPGTGPNPQSIPLFSRPHDTLIQEVFKISNGKIQEINVIRQDMPYRWGGGW